VFEELFLLLRFRQQLWGSAKRLMDIQPTALKIIMRDDFAYVSS
jgi:hypothetical protein